jgi:hypothetical protein
MIPKFVSGSCLKPYLYSMKENWNHLEANRITTGALASQPNERAGAFMFKLADQRQETYLMVIATDGAGAPQDDPTMQWEHVSVHVKFDTGKKIKERTPSWDEMCLIKELFFDPEERVMQFHPPVTEYVNNHLHVLHLWKMMPGVTHSMPWPNPLLVGYLSEDDSVPQDQPTPSELTDEERQKLDAINNPVTE